MKYLGILVLLAWTSSSVAADPPGAALKDLFEKARYEEFVPMAERLAATGDAEAQFYLAQAYHGGKGVDEDAGRALELYEKAARNGHARAMNQLGRLVLHEAEQPGQAAALFQRAIKMGGADLASTDLDIARWMSCTEERNPGACTHAAQAYQAEWERTRADDALAKALDALAANCEHAARPSRGASGQFELPPPNACADAIALSERGASAGSLSATHARARLAAMVGDNPAMLAWLERGAGGGYVKSSEQLGALYAAGEGVPASQEQAREWYEKAVAAGSTRASSWLTAYWEAAARDTTDRSRVKQALDALMRLHPDEQRDAFDAAARLEYLETFARNAEDGPSLKEPLARTICVPELESGRAHAWRIHALNGPDTGDDETEELAGIAQGRTGKSGCLRLAPEAARNIHAIFKRGATPLLAVAQQHYILALGPAGEKVRTVTLAPHLHQHTHDCGCGHRHEE